MWIYGPVGCGKSTIAQAVAEVFARRKRLIASFFFRGSRDRCTTKRFAFAVAAQLVAVIPATAPFMEHALRTHPDLFTTHSLSSQFEHLIYGPLKAFVKRNPLKHSLLRGAYLIVLDGLDKCSDREEVAAFIEHMLEFFQSNPRFPLRFLLTSRAEDHLRSRLLSNQVHVLNLVNHTTLEDIASVVDATFALASKHDRNVRTYGSWPSPQDRQELVEHSGGSLMFMSTILKFILEPVMDGLSPMERLQLVLNVNSGLDGLYTQTLTRSEHLPHFSDIITAIATFDEPPTIADLGAFLGISTFEVVRFLVKLPSILQVPADDHTPITLCHSSVRDFLQDESRSQRFHISQDSKDCLYKRLFTRSENDPALRLLTAMPLLLDTLSITELKSLLDIRDIVIPQHFEKFAVITHDPIGLRSVNPVLRPAFEKFVRRESRTFIQTQQLLAHSCFQAIANPQPYGSNELRYAQTHAMDHWNTFMEAVTRNLFQPTFREAVSNLRQLFSPRPMVDTFLTLLLTLEGDTAAADAGVSLGSLLEPLSRRMGVHWDPLVAEIMESFVRHNGGSLKDIEASLADEMGDMEYDDLEHVAVAHFALLSVREGRIGAVDIDTPFGDIDTPSGRSHKGNLETLIGCAQGSPIFISNFTRFIMELRDIGSQDPLPPVHTTIRDALAFTIPLDGLYTRLLSLTQHPDPRLSTLISAIALLKMRFTIFQLAHFLDVSMVDVRSVLGKLRGVVHLPSDDCTEIVLPGRFLAFLRDQSRAGRFYARPSLHHELAGRCLRVWFEWNTELEELASVRDYCQMHWFKHWEEAQVHVPTSHGTEGIAAIVRLLSDVCSPGAVEVALRTQLDNGDGFLAIVQTLSMSNGSLDRLEPRIETLGCRRDVSEVGRRELLLCARVLLAFQRHYHVLGFALTEADLVDGPIARALSLCAE